MCDIAALVLTSYLPSPLGWWLVPKPPVFVPNYFRYSSNHSPNLSLLGRNYDVLPNWPTVLTRATSYRSCICLWPLRQNTACGRWKVKGENSGKLHNISPFPIPHRQYPHSAYRRYVHHSAYRRYIHHPAEGCVLLKTRSGLESCASTTKQNRYIVR